MTAHRHPRAADEARADPAGCGLMLVNAVSLSLPLWAGIYLVARAVAPLILNAI